MGPRAAAVSGDRRATCTVLLTCAALVLTLLPSTAEAADGHAEVIADAAESGRVVASTADGRTVVHDVASRREAAAVVAGLEADPDVVAVEADVVVHAFSDGALVAGSDPWLASQWEHPATGVDVAHEAGHAGAGTVIAVLDTGVDHAHPDLTGRLVPGWDALTDGPLDPTRADVDGHGTLVAGTAVANADEVGMRGVAPHARVMPVRVLDDTGSGYLSDVTEGIDWAVANGADVINLSLGGDRTSTSMETAIGAAVDAGVVVVAAAGNYGDQGDPTIWPAAYADTVAVAAVDPHLDRASFSSTGEWVDVAAPGVGVHGTLPSASWTTWHGTSAAAPIVAAGVAVLLASGGDAPSDRAGVTAVRDALAATTVDLADPGFDPGTGHGLVRFPAALAALVAEPAPEPDPEPALDPAPVSEPEDPDVATPTPTPTPPPVEPAPIAFTDVPVSNTHAAAIAVLAARGVTTGCAPERYCPGGTVTRAQMASFLARALGLDLSRYRGTFADVPSSSPHARAIEALARAGVTGGCSSGRYCPSDTVSRAQMASFLARAYRLPAGARGQVFDDVPADGTHSPNVAAVARAEITTGCSPTRYCPDAPVRRDQMASFLVRASDG